MLGLSTAPKTISKGVNIRPDQSLAAETVVGHSVKIEGDLVSDGDIKIDGMVHGSVKTSQNLFIGSQARITADVDAGSAIIAGVVLGDLRVAGVASILQTGSVSGNIQCSKIAIEEGAFFNGECTMATRPKDKPFTSSLVEPRDE